MKVLVVYSGGLDSTAIALIKKNKGNYIELLSFDYGQKAQMELKRANNFAKALGVSLNIINISSLKGIFGSKNQLINEDVPIEKNYRYSIIVPLRNAFFLQIAYIYAVTNNFDEVVLGSHLDDVRMDENGNIMFPDCSPSFFQNFEKAMLSGLRVEDKKVGISSASLQGLTKKDLIKESYKINKELLYSSWSCYDSGSKQCGICDSCRNRRKSFQEAQIKDLTDYEK